MLRCVYTVHVFQYCVNNAEMLVLWLHISW